MKKHRVFVSVIFLLQYTHVNAQHEEGATLGIRAGVNYSFLNFNNANESLMPGAGIGLYSKAPIDGKFYIQPEISAAYQNIKVDLEDLDASVIKLSLAYVECVFAGVYQAAPGISVHTGPFISYLFYSKAKSESDDAVTEEFFDRSNFHDINFGLVIGGAYEFKRFDLGLRYSKGMYVIGKERAIGSANDVLRTKNSFLLLYGTIVF